MGLSWALSAATAGWRPPSADSCPQRPLNVGQPSRHPPMPLLWAKLSQVAQAPGASGPLALYHQPQLAHIPRPVCAGPPRGLLCRTHGAPSPPLILPGSHGSPSGGAALPRVWPDIPGAESAQHQNVGGQKQERSCLCGDPALPQGLGLMHTCMYRHTPVHSVLHLLFF